MSFAPKNSELITCGINMKATRVCVVGLGYIGLPTAALLAGDGFSVVGVDVNSSVIDAINSGRPHFVEPQLDVLLQRVVASGALRAYSEPQESDIFMICVPTPFHESGVIPSPNIAYVLSAVRRISPLLQPGNCLIVESTCPVGTTEIICELLQGEGVNVDSIHIAYCPERVLPGKIIDELRRNDRIVGGIDAEASAKVADFYRRFVVGQIYETNARTAEMCKLAENSFRDLNVAFANELSMICANERVDVWELIQLANRHPRVNILQPGAGVGGHCIAVDPWFIVSRNPESAKLIRAAREVNNSKPEWIIGKVKAAISSLPKVSGKTPTVACFGLAFKADVDDLRESPALQIALALKRQGYNVVGVEPHISSHDAIDVVDINDAIHTADFFVILVKHSQFLDVEIVARIRSRPFLDFCGVFSDF